MGLADMYSNAGHHEDARRERPLVRATRSVLGRCCKSDQITERAREDGNLA
jgi:hypothetical protein